MTTLGKVIDTHTDICTSALDLVSRKGRDYNRKQQKDGDTLYNMTVAKQLGVVDTTTQSILVRISDKMMRLISLTSNPKENPEIKTESVKDTIVDMVNYIVYLYCKYEEERNELFQGSIQDHERE